MGAQLHTDFTVHKHQEQPINLINIPYNHIQPTMHKLTAQARTQAHKDNRHENQGLEEIDKEITSNAVKHMEASERSFVDRFRRGGGWSAANLVYTGAVGEQACKFCGNAKQTTEHLV